MDHEFALTLFAKRSTVIYLRLGKVLAKLDIPIELEPVAGLIDMEHYQSVVAAQRIVRDAPIDEYLKAALATACTDWLSATILASETIQEDDDDEPVETWLYEAALLQVSRALQGVEFAEDIQSGKLPGGKFE